MKGFTYICVHFMSGITLPSYLNQFYHMRSLFIALGLLWAGVASAQRENISIGPMIGGTYSTLPKLAGNGLTTKYKAGPAAGVFINYSIKEHFGLSANVLYMRWGTTIETPAPSANLNLDYVHVPVLATYYFGNDMGPGAVRPKIFIGPSVSFQTGQSGSAIINNSAFNKVDVGATAGAGLNIGFARQQWLNIDVRYNLGFSKVYKNIPMYNDVHNQSFSLLVGYSFPLGSYDKKKNSFSGKRR
ncbi:outer membrane protein W [Siphonobacter sp. BAB-5404]|nr:outer membrane protein W [Siphonobacter sp. SORGH_AS_0500]